MTKNLSVVLTHARLNTTVSILHGVNVSTSLRAGSNYFVWNDLESFLNKFVVVSCQIT